MSIDNFWLFALASLMLNLTPGNDMLYVIARSTCEGAKAGVISSLGIMGGCLIHTFAAVVGLSAVIARSAFVFDIIKYAGAAYLLYLGIRSLVSKKRNFEIDSSFTHLSYKKLFWQGAIINVLNPKVALFFLAFLPQFVDPGNDNASVQILFLGIWFDISGTLVNILVAILFGRISNWLNRSPKIVQWQERITGVMLIAFGIKVALSSAKRFNT